MKSQEPSITIGEVKMTLKHELNTKLDGCNLQGIAQLMGYSAKNRAKAVLRIEQVLTDPQMNFYAGGFDLRYTNQEFLEKLCEVVGLDRHNYQDEIDAIHLHHQKFSERFHSYIFAETGFKRNGQSILVLGYNSKFRHFELDCELQMQSVDKQIAYAQSFVKRHYVESNGTLEMWGDIQHYVLVYAENGRVLIDVDGDVANDNQMNL